MLIREWDAHNTEHKSDVAYNQPAGRDAPSAERAARLANFRTSNVAADYRRDCGEQPTAGK